jgi:hypothetical protein
MSIHIKLEVKRLARWGLKKLRELVAAEDEPTPELELEMIRAALEGPRPWPRVR